MTALEQDNHSVTLRDWAVTSIIATVVAFLDIASIYIGVIKPEFIYWSIASEGIITFFGMLIVSSYHARIKPNSKGTMRRAIAGSLVSVYLIVIALGLADKFPDISDATLRTVLEGFSAVIITIIGFYFGAKGAAEVLSKQKNKGV